MTQREDYLQVIATAIDNHPRSLQTAIGPSELGTPCARKLGHKLNHTPPARTLPPGWRPTVGTATHTWLADAFNADNQRLGRERWLIETRVWVGDIDGEMVTGSADLYDLDTATVIDHKVVGPGSIKTYRAAVNRGDCPDTGYRAQLHLYGRGFTLLGQGLPVRHVTIMFLPSAGELGDAVTWTEPFDETVALTTLARADALATGLRMLGPDVILPQLGTTDDRCGHCPWMVPGATDLTRECAGDAALYAAATMPDLMGKQLQPTKGAA